MGSGGFDRYSRPFSDSLSGDGRSRPCEPDRFPGTVCGALREIAHSRGALYEYFGTAFRYPEQEVLNLLRGDGYARMRARINDVYVVLPATSRLIDSFGEVLHAEYGLQDLQVEYSRLFLGPFHVPAPPYESVYRPESRGRLMGDSTLAVLRAYEEEGLAVCKHIREMPDHLLAELEFMGHLAAREEAGWPTDEREAEQCLHKEYRFLSDHLVLWMPLFTEAVHSAANHAFYRVLAQLASSFVQYDRDLVRTIMKWPGHGERG